MNRDLNANVKAVQSIAPAALTATTEGGYVDLAEAAGGLMVILSAGVISAADGSNYMTLTIETNDTGSGSGTAIDADAYLDPRDSDGTTWDRLINATAEGSKTYQVGFINKSNHRYARVVLTETSTFSGILGANIVLGPLKRAPNV